MQGCGVQHVMGAIRLIELSGRRRESLLCSVELGHVVNLTSSILMALHLLCLVEPNNLCVPVWSVVRLHAFDKLLD